MSYKNPIKELPSILVNFKNFDECNGDNALKLAEILQKAATDTGVEIRLSVQSFFLQSILSTCSLKVLAQHLDNKPMGATTGWLVPEVLKSIGGAGSLLNHSEHRIDMEQIKNLVERMNKLGLMSIVCVENVEEVKDVARFNPSYIAIEPPELIGGDVSVSSARPDLISDSVAAANGVPVLVGAGIKDGNDFKVAMNLGASGILVASGVCKAKDPYEVILDFAKSLV